MNLVIAADARTEIAGFVAALIGVYTIVVIAYVVINLVMSLGVRVPYNRGVRAVLDFLHDTAEPYLRIFRKLPLQVGPLDLSPIVAIFALQIVGGIIVAAIEP